MRKYGFECHHHMLLSMMTMHTIHHSRLEHKDHQLVQNSRSSMCMQRGRLHPIHSLSEQGMTSMQ